MRKSLKSFLVLGFFYLICYLGWSLKYGSYEPAAYGLMKKTEAQFTPKKSFGKIWVIENEYRRSGGLSLIGKVFYPLTWLDRKLWHKRITER